MSLTSQIKVFSIYKVFESSGSQASKLGELFPDIENDFNIPIPYRIDRTLQWLKVLSCSGEPRTPISGSGKKISSTNIRVEVKKFAPKSVKFFGKPEHKRIRAV
ncbi:hypothetical protein AMECASPLE_015319 [Ameca splendens]|uniref:Uncharacterized protein n=1 Tax=Ameca splendens TaxID=208324 RepID=A0ABV0ZBM5_9TELE